MACARANPAEVFGSLSLATTCWRGCRSIALPAEDDLGVMVELQRLPGLADDVLECPEEAAVSLLRMRARPAC
jgi:hypothetical protein